jgi:hypothetical protein
VKIIKKIKEFFKYRFGPIQKTPYCDGWNYVTCQATGNVEYCRKHNPDWEKECKESFDMYQVTHRKKGLIITRREEDEK